ncbi:MAG: alcohol dehydrogenase catalytic domain-containing protein [Verrucomicrobia bacterium]|nr:alcohol dehydrogenase catalytic domain-containing protein [Verrucomicrobiota bacterium]
MAKMRAMQVTAPGKPFELVEKEIPEPTKKTVRIKVQVCGICHSDSFTKEGTFPGIQYPRVPGHEVAGIIDKVGPDVVGWNVGEKVGVGWFGGNCGVCESCRRGDFLMCSKMQISGISYDGGYQEYMIAHVSGLARIPDELSSADAGPLLCAGITTFNALRHSGAIGGDVVAILGIGGLGHLGVQYAAKMGFKTVAIARGTEKAALAKKLGAAFYINSETQNVVEELQKLGGAKVILSTVTESKALATAVEGLSIDGKLVIVGATATGFEVLPLALIKGRKSIMGWPSGTAKDSEDTLAFSALANIRSMNQTFPLEKAEEAYQLMMSGKARFRVVLVMG